MPNRIIKESILTSPRICGLSVEAERHFYRLLLLSDDYGCFENTPAVVKGRCYSLHEQVTIYDVAGWSAELIEHKIISEWEQDGRRFAVYRNFDKHNSKYSVTDEGKNTRHRRKTPPPPEGIHNNGLSQPSPPLASTSQPSPNPNHNPNPKPNPESKNSIIIKQSVPDAAAFPLAQYQTEVLDKCVGRTAGTDNPRAALIFLIAKHIPREFVMEALGAMQDARNNNKNPSPDVKHVTDLERYYFGTIKKMCLERNIETPIKWEK